MEEGERGKGHHGWYSLPRFALAHCIVSKNETVVAEFGIWMCNTLHWGKNILWAKCRNWDRLYVGGGLWGRGERMLGVWFERNGTTWRCGNIWHIIQKLSVLFLNHIEVTFKVIFQKERYIPYTSYENPNRLCDLFPTYFHTIRNIQKKKVPISLK